TLPNPTPHPYPHAHTARQRKKNSHLFATRGPPPKQLLISKKPPARLGRKKFKKFFPADSTEITIRYPLLCRSPSTSEESCLHGLISSATEPCCTKTSSSGSATHARCCAKHPKADVPFARLRVRRACPCFILFVCRQPG